VSTATVSNLQRANDVRRRRKDEHARLHALPQQAGRAELAALLEDPPAWLESASIGDVLRWPFRTTNDTLCDWLEAAVASPLARVAGTYARPNSNQHPAVLSERQRLILVACLRGTYNEAG
jgi:hypothetical protein